MVRLVELDPEAVDAVLKGKSRYSYQPLSKDLERSMKNELESWNTLLRKRGGLTAHVVMGIALSLYGLPKGSRQFVKGAWDRWQ